MKVSKYWIFIIPISFMFIPTVYYLYNVQAQVEPIDRYFQKDFCMVEQTLFDDINYVSGEQVSYDSVGCPVSTKIVHRWNELSVINQNLIVARMSNDGYSDVTNQVLLQQK